MDTLSCKAFLEAVRVGTFAGAAKNLGYTTSGLSHLIGGLEKELGFALLFRRSRGVVPTDAGKLFVPIAEEFLAQEQRVYRFADDIKDIAVGHVVIGAFPSIAAYLLPPVIKTFRSRYPGVEVSIEENPHFHIMEDLMAGSYDLAFLTAEEPLSGDLIPLQKDRLVVALPKDHPAAGKKAFPVRNLSKEPLLIQGLYDEEEGNSQFLPRFNLSRHTIGNGLSNATILGMVKEGLAVGLLYELSTAHWEDEVALRPLSPSQTIYICVAAREQRQLSAAAARFLDVTREYFGA